jgi:hypothetical protein
VWLAGLFGRLAPWKGQHIAFEAMARPPDAHLVLVGAPPFGEDAYGQRLHEQAEFSVDQYVLRMMPAIGQAAR